MKNIKKPNKRGRSSQNVRIQTIEEPKHIFKENELGGIDRLPNPRKRKQAYIIHRQNP